MEVQIMNKLETCIFKIQPGNGFTAYGITTTGIKGKSNV